MAIENALLGQPVQGGRLDEGMARCAYTVEAVLVNMDEQEVRL
jgi:hypothetical protein